MHHFSPRGTGFPAGTVKGVERDDQQITLYAQVSARSSVIVR